MVRHFPAALLMGAVLLAPAVTLAERPVFSAESLKQRMEGSAEESKRAGDRLKASRGDLNSLQLLNSDNLTFKLPNGKLVSGVLLPTGRVAPAIDNAGKRIPACVTTENKLVPGLFDATTETIQCQVAQAELAILEDGSTAQVALVPEKKDVVVKSTKYDRSSQPVAAPAPTAARSATSSSPSTATASPPADPNVYRPPIRNTTQKATVAGVMTRDKNLFGIPIGTWANGQLLRRVSSAEGGTIEFELTEDIEGKYQVMPAGTVLFARKEINMASRRLESISVTARLPDGREVPGVEFRVFGTDKTSGLSGQLVRDTEGEIVHAGTNALLNAAGNVAISAGNNVTGGLAEDLRGDLVGNEQRALKQAPKAVIEVSAQPVLLQVVKGF